MGPVIGRGPCARSNVQATNAVTNTRARHREGAGHADQIAMMAPTAIRKPTGAGKVSGTDACGQAASHEATATAPAPAAPAKPSTTAPIAGLIPETASPMRPASNTTETSGPTATFATGDTSDST